MIQLDWTSGRSGKFGRACLRDLPMRVARRAASRHRVNTSLTLLFLVIPGILCGVAGNASAQQAHQSDSVHARRSDAAGPGLITGNVAELERFEKAGRFNPALTAVWNAQIRYQLPKLGSTAQRCRQAALDYARKPPVHLVALGWSDYCDRVAGSVASVTGNAREFFRALAWGKNVLFPAYTQLIHKRAPAMPPPIARLNLVKLAQSLPRTTAKISDPRGSLAIINNLESRTLAKGESGVAAWRAPLVEVVINGKRVPALVDTGTDLSMVVDRGFARANGLKPIVTGVPALPFLDKPYPPPNSASWDLVADFRFGSLTVHNLMAEVVPDGYSDAPVMVGLPTLARFKQVTFSRSRITLANAPTPCAHPIPMTFASNPSELGHLLFAATADGKPVSAAFDSGSDELLIAGSELMHHQPPIKPNAPPKPGERFDRIARRGYLDVTIGWGHITSYDAAFMPRLSPPMGVLVGVPLLATADVTLTFGNDPSICIAPRSRSP